VLSLVVAARWTATAAVAVLCIASSRASTRLSAAWACTHRSRLPRLAPTGDGIDRRAPTPTNPLLLLGNRRLGARERLRLSKRACTAAESATNTGQVRQIQAQCAAERGPPARARQGRWRASGCASACSVCMCVYACAYTIMRVSVRVRVCVCMSSQRVHSACMAGDGEAAAGRCLQLPLGIARAPQSL
jgi:hypothetical protein